MDKMNQTAVNQNQVISARESAIQTIKKTAEKWPSSFVARRDSRLFSGGLFAPGSLANADCRGDGPAGAFKIGRQQVYPVESFCNWLIKKMGDTI
jgi:hypothetical protein